MPPPGSLLALTAALAGALVPGCASRAANVTALTLGTVAIGVGLAVGPGEKVESGCLDGPGCIDYGSHEAGGPVLVTLGAILVVVGGLGLLRRPLSPAPVRDRREALPPPEQPLPLPAPPPPPHPLADVASQMHSYATAGDCLRVQMLADELWELDEPYSHQVLDSDPLVRACLAEP